MRTKREKYKVRLVLGWNAIRRVWTRNELNRRKWRKKETVLRVRNNNPKRPVTGRKPRTNRALRGGGVFPRRSRIRRKYRKKRNGRKGRRRIYSGWDSPQRIRAVGRDQKKKNLNSYDSIRDASVGAYYKGKEITVPRTTKTTHRRGKREIRAAVRRWRIGIVPTRPIAVKLLEGNHVQDRNGNRRKGNDYRKVGDGIQIKEDTWKERKVSIQEYIINIGKKNGRTGRGYVEVDYRTGTVVFKRKPLSGEFRIPEKIERTRNIRKK